jgi:hypothetical protein
MSETKIDENGIEYTEVEYTDDQGMTIVSRVY